MHAHMCGHTHTHTHTYNTDTSTLWVAQYCPPFSTPSFCALCRGEGAGSLQAALSRFLCHFISYWCLPMAGAVRWLEGDRSITDFSWKYLRKRQWQQHWLSMGLWSLLRWCGFNNCGSHRPSASWEETGDPGSNSASRAPSSHGIHGVWGPVLLQGDGDSGPECSSEGHYSSSLRETLWVLDNPSVLFDFQPYEW